MKFEVKERWETSTGRQLVNFFFKPWMAMLAWGAFIHMSGVNLPAFGYWEAVMLNISFMVFRSTGTIAWEIKSK